MIQCILFYLFVIISLLILVTKLVFKYYTRWNKSYACLVGKTTIVTGSNTGIGYYTALDFAKRGARVILACRNKQKAEKARDQIIASTNNPNVIVKLIDFTSLQSVRDFAKDFNETEERLDILVNNAGAAGLGNCFTKDNLQITWHVNHYSAFLLTHLLIEKLKISAGKQASRIVNVSSIASKYGKIDINNINRYPNKKSLSKSDTQLYFSTKLANVLFTRELALRVVNDNINVYSVHPGVVATDIWRRLPKPILIVVTFIMSNIFRSSEEGAQTTLTAAMSSDLDYITGKYLSECSVQDFYESCKDMELAKALWIKSEEMVKLSKEEKIKKQ